MLTHFGTVFALCRNYDSLTQHLTHFNNVKLSQKRCFTWNGGKGDVSRGTKYVDVAKLFHVEQEVLTDINFIL